MPQSGSDEWVALKSEEYLMFSMRDELILLGQIVLHLGLR